MQTFIFFSGNLLTVVALLRCPKLRCHATTMFVISLAMSDLLFSTINLPLTASRYIHEDWKLGVPMCRYFIFSSYWALSIQLVKEKLYDLPILTYKISIF